MKLWPLALAACTSAVYPHKTVTLYLDSDFTDQDMPSVTAGIRQWEQHGVMFNIVPASHNSLVNADYDQFSLMKGDCNLQPTWAAVTRHHKMCIGPDVTARYVAHELGHALTGPEHHEGNSVMHAHNLDRDVTNEDEARIR